MNPIETILLNFLKSELQKNPALAGNLLMDVLEKLKVDPTIANDVNQLVQQLLPVIIAAIK